MPKTHEYFWNYWAIQTKNCKNENSNNSSILNIILLLKEYAKTNETKHGSTNSWLVMTITLNVNISN